MNTQPRSLLVSLALAAACAPQMPTSSDRPPLLDDSDPGPHAEQLAVRDALDAVFAGVDAHRWAQVEATMTPTLQVDYAALGGPTGSIAAAELVGGWADFLPRFDRTVHALHDVSIHVAGDRAAVTFDGIAVHALTVAGRTQLWTVFAGYDTELERIDGQWKLAKIDLSVREQTGNLELPALAQSAPSTPAAEAEARPEIEAFFGGLESNDLDAALATLDDDVVQQMPLAPAGFPQEVRGRAAITELLGTIIDHDQRYTRRYHATRDPSTVLVSFEGEVHLDEGVYRNRYVNLFELDDDGRIVRIVEHFSPRTLQASWPGLTPPHHSVHAAGAPVDAVELERVVFPSGAHELQGNLFLPAGFDPSERYPAVIVAGSWTSVKEQMPDLYASRLAEQGLVALSFDFTGFGASEGELRQLEDPSTKIADIQAAFEFLSSREELSTISGLGICAGAGYMAHAVANEPGFARLALVAPWLHDEAIARSIYDARPGGAQGLIDASRQAQQHYARGGEPRYVLAASELDQSAAMYVPNDVFDYYLNPTTGAGSHYDNRFAVASWEGWITFDGISAASGIDQPVHIVHSELGAVPDGARRFFDQLPGERSIDWLDDYSQEQFYHQPAAVDEAVDAVTGFLGATR